VVSLTDLIDVDELAEQITKQAISRAKELVANKVVARSGDDVSRSLLNVANALEKSVAGKFEVWADQDGKFVAPTGTRFVHHTKNVTIFVVEQKPCYRTINVSPAAIAEFSRKHGNQSRKRGIAKTLHLPFPYVIYVPVFCRGQFQGMGVYYSNKPVSSLTQALHYNNLPNFVGGGKSYCSGNAERDIGMNLGQRVESTIRGFWNSNFNNDASGNWAGKRQPFKSLTKWANLSLLEITKVKWCPATSVEKIIKDWQKQSGKRPNKSLVKAVCQDTAPDIERAILSSLKRVRIGKRDETALRGEIGSLIEQKLESVNVTTTKKVAAKKTTKKRVVKKKKVPKKAVKKKSVRRRKIGD